MCEYDDGALMRDSLLRFNRGIGTTRSRFLDGTIMFACVVTGIALGAAAMMNRGNNCPHGGESGDAQSSHHADSPLPFVKAKNGKRSVERKTR